VLCGAVALGAPALATLPAQASAASYSGAVLADAPAAYWRLGETAGPAVDKSGHGANGTYSGGVTRAVPGALTGDPDPAADFDGASGAVTVADSAALRLNGPFTIELWARSGGFANSWPGLLVKGASGTSSGYLIWYSSNGQLFFKRNNVSLGSPVGALTTTWRHFAVTYDGTSLRWYVDGRQVTATAVQYPSNSGTAPLQLGRGDQYGREGLDEVAIYNRALTASQVSAHRTAGMTAPTPSGTPTSAPPSTPATTATPSATSTPSSTGTPTSTPSSTGTPTSTPSSTGTPTGTPTGPVADPVIAAAGDVACDPTDQNYNAGAGTALYCRQQSTAALLAPRLTAVLPLGDEQYTDGALSKFQSSYDTSWGATKSRQRPVPGNHEYLTSGASGYYTYFGSAAGQPSQGWYSYDVGSWHLIALNAECAEIGGCGAGSPEETWLRQDLAAHPAACTLAYWHQPEFTGVDWMQTTDYQAFWQDLYSGGAEVVLNGHAHNYERFAPMNSTGAPVANGVREFVVGTGGKDLMAFTAPASAATEVRDSSTYGVLQLVLHPGSYSWSFVPTSGSSFTDSGSTACH
jgi:hypothetical protein